MQVCNLSVSLYLSVDLSVSLSVVSNLMVATQISKHLGFHCRARVATRTFAWCCWAAHEPTPGTVCMHHLHECTS